MGFLQDLWNSIIKGQTIKAESNESRVNQGASAIGALADSYSQGQQIKAGNITQTVQQDAHALDALADSYKQGQLIKANATTSAVEFAPNQIETRRAEREALNKQQQTLATTNTYDLAGTPRINTAYKDKNLQDYTAFLPAGQQYLAIVDNSHDGIWAEGSGYLTTRCNGAKDGDVVFVDNTGTVTSINLDELSDDYRAKVIEFQTEAGEAREAFKLSKQFQEEAAKGNELANGADTEDNSQVNSIFDILMNWAAYSRAKNSRLVAMEGSPATNEAAKALTQETFEKLREAEDEYIYRTGIHQMVTDKSKTIKSWQEAYARDPQQAAKDLMEADMSDREREYIAYTMVAQVSENKGLSDYAGTGLKNTLLNLSESMDWLSDPIKGTVMWLDAQDGEMWTRIGDTQLAEELNNKNWFEVIGSCYQASWVNEGRASYNYDTGFLPFDLALEIISDPEFIIKAISKTGATLTAKGVLKSAADSGIKDVEFNPTTLNAVFKKAARDGLSEDEIIKRIVASVPDASKAGCAQVLSDALEYSKAWKISKAATNLALAKNQVDDIMLYFTGIKEMGFAAGGIVNAITKGDNTKLHLATKILGDSATETLAKTGTREITLEHLPLMLDEIRVKILGANIAGEDLGKEISDAVEQGIMNNYFKSVADAEEWEAKCAARGQSLADLPFDVKSVAEYKADAMKALESVGLQDSVSYKLLSNEPIEMPIACPTQIEYGSYISHTEPDVLKERIKSLNIPEINTTEYNLIETLASDVKEKLYVAKYNDIETSGFLMKNEYLRDICQSIDRWDDSTVYYLRVAREDSVSGAAVRDIISHKTGIDNYSKILDGLDNLIKDNLITPKQARAFQDYLFNDSFRAYVDNTFSAGVDKLSEDAIKGRARSIARRWYDGTSSIEARKLTSQKYDYMECNTRDLQENIRMMEYYYEELDNGKFPVEDRLVFYSVNTDNYGAVSEIAIKQPGDEVAKIYKMDNLKSLYADIQRIMTIHDGHTTRLISFNNHAAGYDIDAALARRFMHEPNNLMFWFKKTEDIADLYRFNDFKGLKIDDTLIDVLERMIDDTLHDWVKTYLKGSTYGVPVRYGLTPPTLSEVENLAESLRAETDGFGKTLCDSLDNTIKAQYKEYKALTNELSLLRDVDNETFVKISNEVGPEVGLKLMFDFKTVDKFFYTKHQRLSDIIGLYPAAKQINKIARQLYDPAFISTFKADIDKMYLEYQRHNHTYAVHKFIDCEDTRGRLAILIWANKDAPEIFRPLSEKRFPFKKALQDPYNSILRPVQKYTNGLERLPGSLDNPWSSWNVEEDLYKEMSRIDSAFETLDEYENFRALNGLGGELEAAHMRVRNELRKPYDDLKELLRADFEYMWTKHHKSETHKATNEYAAWWVERQTTPGSEAYNRAMYHAYIDREITRGLWLEQLTDEEFYSHLMYDCHGKMVIDPNVYPDIRYTINRRKLPDDVIIDEFHGMYRIYSTADASKVKDIVPRFENWYDVELNIGDEIIEGVDESARIYWFARRLEEFNDKSFTYGNWLPNDMNMDAFISGKYFPGIEFPQFHETSQYFCGYLGSNVGLMGDGSYTSGNMLNNLFNSYNRTLMRNEKNYNWLKTVFSGTTLRDYCGKTPAETVVNELKDRGYEIWALDGLDVVRCTNDFEKYIDKPVAIMRADESKVFLEGIRVSSDDNKFFDIIKSLRKVESYWIRGYLYTNPATWVHNAIDSTSKALLSEGSSHFKYMQEAMYLLPRYNELTDNIIKEYGSVSMTAITDYYKRHPDFPISLDRAKQLFQYKLSTISGARFDEYIFDDFSGKDADPFKFNEHMFSAVEAHNRLAIFLKHMDEGDNFGGAYRAVAESQFDYAKNQKLKVLDTLAPFSTFKLYNLKYWLCDVWAHPVGGTVSALTKMYRYDGDDREDYYWSEEAQEYRAWLMGLENTERSYKKDYHYNSYEDYAGSDKATALDNGWVQIGDKMYFKLGLSLIDALSSTQYFYTVADVLSGRLSSIKDLAESELFAPVTAMPNALKGLYHMKDVDWENEEEVLQWHSDYGYDIATMIPMAGTAYYMVASGRRNWEMYEREEQKGTVDSWLATMLPGLFAPGEYKDNWYDETYLSRPIGFNWYDMSEEERKNYRYVMGVSYVPAWVAKDPAAYINHWGRLQQITGFDNEQMQQFMNDGGGFWFTKNNDGSYSLHNYKLMVGDEETWNRLYSDLVTQWHWTDADALRLLNEAAIPMWRTNFTSNKKSGSTGQSRSDSSISFNGYGKYSNMSYDRFRTQAAYNGKTYVRNSKYNYNPTGKTLGSRLTKGKNVQYSNAAMRMQNRGHSGYQISRQLQSEHRWHHRQRDIYKDNYAKYGASRMAMEQNLRNYSNRSITEMRRTNQNIRYNQIHNHSGWWA